MSYTQTPYVPYGSAESFGEAEARLATERAKLLQDKGFVPSNSSIDGRVVGKNPKDGRKYIYDTQTNEWRRTFGGYKKIPKIRYAKKCAKSSKKCRYSHYKNTVKRSRRRTNKKK